MTCHETTVSTISSDYLIRIQLESAKTVSKSMKSEQNKDL